MDLPMIISLLTALMAAPTTSREFIFVNKTLSWTRAQDYCRTLHTDLATIETLSDQENIPQTDTGEAWIGLFDSWKWSLDNSSFYADGGKHFRSWHPVVPYYSDQSDFCARLTNDPHFGSWNIADCHKNLTFICYAGVQDGTETYVMVNNRSSWPEAQKICRENFVDLVSIRNEDENAKIAQIAGDNQVWIGLFLAKQWSDRSGSASENTSSPDPNLCVTLSQNSGLWTEQNCSHRLPFICYRSVQVIQHFLATGQYEYFISLAWENIPGAGYILWVNGEEETHIPARSEMEYIHHNVHNLSPATMYKFTLSFVINVTQSKGISISSSTAPLPPQDFILAGLNETSVSLQWTKLRNYSYILEFADRQIEIHSNASTGQETINYTVTSLDSISYTFRLFAIYNNVRSGGAVVRAHPGPFYALGFDVRVRMDPHISDHDLKLMIIRLANFYNFPPFWLSLRRK